MKAINQNKNEKKLSTKNSLLIINVAILSTFVLRLLKFKYKQISAYRLTQILLCSANFRIQYYRNRAIDTFKHAKIYIFFFACWHTM